MPIAACALPRDTQFDVTQVIYVYFLDYVY